MILRANSNALSKLSALTTGRVIILPTELICCQHLNIIRFFSILFQWRAMGEGNIFSVVMGSGKLFCVLLNY